MRITVDRYHSTDKATLSRVSVDGAFVCYGLEDEHRVKKLRGETRIPAGVYDVTLRTVGGFHGRYARDPRTRDFHEGMLWVRDVPGFEYILLHIGNFERDTDGCLLVGMTASHAHMAVYRSAEAYQALYRRVVAAAKAGALTIDYQDNDGAKA